MHSWASWFLLALYSLTILAAISREAKEGPGWTVLTVVIYVAICTFVALVVLPTGGFVW